MKNFHQHYKNSKSKNRKKLLVSYQYQESALRGKSGYGHIELSTAGTTNLNATTIRKHIEKVLLEDNQIKASVIILGISQL